MKALNPFAPFWYVPECDRDAEHPTRFKLRGLNGDQMGYVAPELHLSELQRIDGISGKGIAIALGHGLLDWENLEGATGPLPFTQANAALLPHDVRTELAMRILIASSPGEEEKKT